MLVQRERSALRSEMPALAQRLYELLTAVCPSGNCQQQAIVEAFLPRLPEIRARLDEDVEAAFHGDPAARGYDEIVSAIPRSARSRSTGSRTSSTELDVPLLPRIMTEHAHS